MLGYKRYLYYFALFKIKTLKSDAKEKDFFVFAEKIHGSGAVLDIGANIGIMTVHLARIFPEKKILAFEPVPSNFSVLQKIVHKYQLEHVSTYELALGQESEDITMVLPTSGKVKMQGLSHVVHPELNEWNEGEKFTVKSTALDKMNLGAVAGIKMDVENFEYFVLLGGEKLLKENKPLIYMELWDNENRQKCFDYLKALCYQIYVVDNDNLCLYDPLKHRKQNFIFQ